jgi:hypothetical protein
LASKAAQDIQPPQPSLLEIAARLSEKLHQLKGRF